MEASSCLLSWNWCPEYRGDCWSVTLWRGNGGWGMWSAIQLSPNPHKEWRVLPLLVLWGTPRWDGHGFVCRGLYMKPAGDPAAYWSAWDCQEVPPHSEPWLVPLQFAPQHPLSPVWRCPPLPHNRCAHWWGEQVCALGCSRINTQFPQSHRTWQGLQSSFLDTTQIPMSAFRSALRKWMSHVHRKGQWGHSLPSCRCYAPMCYAP